MFTAKFLSDDSTSFHNLQTNVRYILAKWRNEFALYREGELLAIGERAHCVNIIEVDGNHKF